MNLAILNDSTEYTGLGRYASDLASATNAKLISLNLDSSVDPSAYPGTVAYFKPFLKVGTGWFMSHRMPSIFLSGVRTQIVNQIDSDTTIHYASQGVPYLNLKNRYVFTVHDLFGMNLKFTRDLGLRKFLQSNLKFISSGERVVTVSQHIRSQLQEIGIDRKIDVIYPPVSRSFKRLDDRINARKLLGLPESKKLILSVSSQDPRKNLKAVAETMQYLGDDYKLVRIGKPIGNCFSFRNIDDEKLNMIYNASDALLFPSLDEGFGYPLAEAMTVGLPSVASDIEIFRETAGDAAVLVDPSPVKLAKAIQEAIANSEQLAKKGIKKSERYSLERFKSDVCALYSELELDGF